MVRGRPKKTLTNDELDYLLQKYVFSIKNNEIHCELNNVKNRVIRYRRNQKMVFSFLGEVETNKRVYIVSDLAKDIFFETGGEKNLLLIDQLLTILINENIRYNEISKEEFEKRYNNLVNEYFIAKGRVIK